MRETKTVPFDAAATLDTQTAIVEYLTAALETNDAAHISRSVGVAARAARPQARVPARPAGIRSRPS